MAVSSIPQISGVYDDFIKTSKTIVFDGLTVGTGAIGTSVFFDVTGFIYIYNIIFCVVEGLGVDAGTGVASVRSTGLIASTTATALTTDTIWVDTAPTNSKPIPTAMEDLGYANRDVFFAVDSTGTQKVVSGELLGVIFWLPLSSNGNVKPGP